MKTKLFFYSANGIAVKHSCKCFFQFRICRGQFFYRFTWVRDVFKRPFFSVPLDLFNKVDTLDFDNLAQLISDFSTVNYMYLDRKQLPNFLSSRL